MNQEGKERRLLRLRGWGRAGGIQGRTVRRRGRAQPPKESRRKADGIAEMRRAAALYLRSRACVARDVAHILLPGREASVEAERDDRGGGGDLMIFTRSGVFLVGFALAKRRPAPALARMAGRVRDLGQTCRIIHAETPAHAVEQLARLIDGEDK